MTKIVKKLSNFNTKTYGKCSVDTRFSLFVRQADTFEVKLFKFKLKIDKKKQFAEIFNQLFCRKKKLIFVKEI